MRRSVAVRQPSDLSADDAVMTRASSFWRMGICDGRAEGPVTTEKRARPAIGFKLSGRSAPFIARIPFRLLL